MQSMVADLLKYREESLKTISKKAMSMYLYNDMAFIISKSFAHLSSTFPVLVSYTPEDTFITPW